MRKKLNLGDLKIESFVTDLDQTVVETVKGGAGEGVGGVVVSKEPDYYTRVHNCNQDTSLYRCPTQDKVGACVPLTEICGVTGHGGCATMYAPYNGC